MSNMKELLTKLEQIKGVQKVLPLQDRLFLMELELREELRQIDGTNLLLKFSLGRLIRLMSNTRQGLPPSLFTVISVDLDPRG